MAHTLPPLPYDENALAPYVSAQTLSFHYGKHHTGYLNNMNKAIAGTELESLSLVDLIRTVAKNAEQKTLFNNAAQVWNHTFYWNSMRPGGGGEPGGTLGELIKDSFGSYDEFKKQFITAGTTQFGSGYAWLVKDGEKLVVTKTPNAETPLTDESKVPLLNMDVWEHAYYLDYQNLRPDYENAFADNLINWEFAEKNLERVFAG
ncbi:superoxide dismutase [Gloeobacter morelensis]|uniref:Superoxide dismutase n=1 Tax=Gloeobacter morelensis MG652769 TaxID=2781736 RepID=A0ABY3PHY3_9CYAN|nr:superoxide dismutase [Gloeobacter morelensis]UFP93218.1 superoxide dismutase [Gloeobacter morelensis MG652769]